MDSGGTSAGILSPRPVFSPRDPGGKEASTGQQAMMGEEPVGIVPDGGSEVGIPVFLEQQRTEQPPTPVRQYPHHRATQSADANPIVAFLVGEPPPPPKTPPPARRRSRSTPRVSNRGNSQSFDDSTVVTAESQRSSHTPQQRLPVEERLRVARTMRLARELYQKGMIQVVDPPTLEPERNGPAVQVPTPRLAMGNNEPTPRVGRDQENMRPFDSFARHSDTSSFSVTVASPTQSNQLHLSVPLSNSMSLRGNGDVQAFLAQDEVSAAKPSHQPYINPGTYQSHITATELRDVQSSARSEVQEIRATALTSHDHRQHSKAGRSFDEATTIKEGKRGFFGKLFGRNKKKKDAGKVAVAKDGVAQPRKERVHPPQPKSQASVTTHKSADKESIESRFDTSMPRRDENEIASRQDLSPVQYYHNESLVENDRPGSIFFANDEVSAMTIPTFDTGLRLKDPEEDRSGLNSEPVGVYWNKVQKVEAVDEDGVFDPFLEPDGTSPRMAHSAAEASLRLKTPANDPVGESPVNSSKVAWPKATVQTNLQDPSPRGFQSPVVHHSSYNDPVGESPLHKHLRGPTAFLDGSPYAQDPPLYFSGTSTETAQRDLKIEVSPSRTATAEMDFSGSAPTKPSPQLSASSPRETIRQEFSKAHEEKFATFPNNKFLLLPPPPPPPMPPPRHSSSASKGRRRKKSEGTVSSTDGAQVHSVRPEGDDKEAINLSISQPFSGETGPRLFTDARMRSESDEYDRERNSLEWTDFRSGHSPRLQASAKVLDLDPSHTAVVNNESARRAGVTDVIDYKSPREEHSNQSSTVKIDEKVVCFEFPYEAWGSKEGGSNLLDEIDESPHHFDECDFISPSGSISTYPDPIIGTSSLQSSSGTSYGTIVAEHVNGNSEPSMIKTGRSTPSVVAEMPKENDLWVTFETEVPLTKSPVVSEVDQVSDAERHNPSTEVNAKSSSPSGRDSPSLVFSQKHNRFLLHSESEGVKTVSSLRDGVAGTSKVSGGVIESVTPTEPPVTAETEDNMAVDKSGSASRATAAAIIRAKSRARHAVSPLRVYESSDEDSLALNRPRRRKTFALNRCISQIRKPEDEATSQSSAPPTPTRRGRTKGALLKYPNRAHDSSDDESFTVKTEHRRKSLNKNEHVKGTRVTSTESDDSLAPATGSCNEKQLPRALLTVSTAAQMNARAVAYLHSLNGDPSPRHNWRRTDVEESPFPSPQVMASQKLTRPSFASRDTEAEVVTAPAIKDEAARLFSAYSGRFNGRKPSTPGTVKRDLRTFPMMKVTIAPKTSVEKSNKVPLWKLASLSGRDTSISATAVHMGYQLRRQKRMQNIANGKAKPVIPRARQVVNKVESYFSPLDEPEPKDPILRAGRRLLSKAAVPVQTAIRRYLAQKEAVNRMWALLEIQSQMRRWRGEANFIASRASAIAIQKAYRGFVVRARIETERKAAVNIQRIFRGYNSALHVYELVYRIIQVQARARGLLVRRRIFIRNFSATSIQACYRGVLVRRLLTLQHDKATSIQTIWRMYQIRQCFQFLIVDVIICQSTVRRWLAKRRADTARASRLQSAAIHMQTAWRCHITLKNFRCYKAARKIQSLVRTVPAKRELRALRASTKIQRSWRQYFRCKSATEARSAIKIQSVARRWPLWRKFTQYRSATRIQTAIRRYLCYKSYKHYRSATQIQAMVRGSMLRIRALRTFSAVKIQAHVRGLIEYQKYERHRAAVAIQAVWRGFQNYTDFIFTLVDVIIVQRTMRGFLARRRCTTLRKEKSALKIQARWRCWAARRDYIAHLYNVIVLQSVGRMFLSKLKARSLRQMEHDEKQKRVAAATTIQAAWRGFWLCSHYLIMRYEATRLQSIARGRAASKKYNLTLGCCIMIQTAMRRYLGAQMKTHKLVELTVIGSSAALTREGTAARKLQMWWRVVLACRKEKRAALIIERFFIMVKEEVDREIKRAQERLKQKKLKRKKRRDGGKALEEVWLQMLDENSSQADVFSIQNSMAADSRGNRAAHGGRPPAVNDTEKKISIRHAASSPSMKLVMRHDDNSPLNSMRPSRSPISHKSLARRFKSLLDDDRSVDRTHESFPDEQDSTAGRSSSIKSGKAKSGSAEKYRQKYGIKSEPNSTSQRNHFFGDSPPVSKSQHTSAPRRYSNYQMVPSRSSSVPKSATKNQPVTGESPRHGQILVMQPYPDHARKAKQQSLIDDEEELNGREEFGLI